MLAQRQSTASNNHQRLLKTGRRVVFGVFSDDTAQQSAKISLIYAPLFQLLQQSFTHDTAAASVSAFSTSRHLCCCFFAAAAAYAFAK